MSAGVILTGNSLYPCPRYRVRFPKSYRRSGTEVDPHDTHGLDDLERLVVARRDVGLGLFLDEVRHGSLLRGDLLVDLLIDLDVVCRLCQGCRWGPAEPLVLLLAILFG